MAPADAGGPSPAFAERLLAWYAVHGRRGLPWTQPRSPYRVWLSEVMLQQTQVTTVIPYFQRFIARFPDVQTLAEAPLDDVLAHWSGLGYYARARNLHAAARQIVVTLKGRFPETVEGWQAIPGVGRSTAGAIVAQAFDRRAAVLDGNVRRWLARHAGIEGWPGQPAVQARLWQEAEARLPEARFADYAQASMDLGALICTARRPACAACPVAADCVARLGQRVPELPSARPRRPRPQRSARLVLLFDAQGRLYLERRPARGIWGGLFCPPMIGEGANETPDSLAGARLTDRLETLEHAFTHYDLSLHPERWLALDPPPLPGRWLCLADALATGLPAPVRRLLESLENPVP